MAAMDYAEYLIHFGDGERYTNDRGARYADLFLPGGREMEGDAKAAWEALATGFVNARHAEQRMQRLHKTVHVMENALPEIDGIDGEDTNDLFDFAIDRIERHVLEIGDTLKALAQAAEAFAPKGADR